MDTFLSQLEDFISYKHFILRIKQILNIKKIPNNINIEPNYNFIRFENVDFNYLPNKKVLDNLNFQINP
jgi:ABC-type multidrug transport system fused ATPase/permease subunit